MRISQLQCPNEVDVNQRTVVWKAVEYEGLEHLVVNEEDGRLHDVHGDIIGFDSGRAFKCAYFITFDAKNSIEIIWVTSAKGKNLSLGRDARGWGRMNDRPPSLNTLPDEFDGCIDIDITATPFTNTLPIRRIDWEVGQSEDLKMLYITVPELTLSVSRQRYTCLEKSAEGGLFKFEVIEDDGSTSFEALLPVDADGLVIDYPGLFKRLMPRSWEDMPR